MNDTPPPFPLNPEYESDIPLDKAIYALCETVFEFSPMWDKMENRPDDSREVARLTIEWAAKFEARYAGKQYGEDGVPDYFDAVDEFFKEQYAKWENGIGAVRTSEWTVVGNPPTVVGDALTAPAPAVSHFFGYNRNEYVQPERRGGYWVDGPDQQEVLYFLDEIREGAPADAHPRNLEDWVVISAAEIPMLSEKDFRIFARTANTPNLEIGPESIQESPLSEVGRQIIEAEQARRDKVQALCTVIENGGKNCISKVQRIIAEGVDLSAKYADDRPTCVAVMSANYEVLDLLIKAGADLEAPDCRRTRPLQLALPRDLENNGRNSLGCLERLIAAKVNLDTPFDTYEFVAPLMRAARYGNPEQVAMLIAGGADVTRRDVAGATAAMHAAAGLAQARREGSQDKDHAECIKLIQAAVARLAATSQPPMPPLPTPGAGKGKSGPKV